jgi:hypothetical protein
MLVDMLQGKKLIIRPKLIVRVVFSRRNSPTQEGSQAIGILIGRACRIKSLTSHSTVAAIKRRKIAGVEK